MPLFATFETFNVFFFLLFRGKVLIFFMLLMFGFPIKWIFLIRFLFIKSFISSLQYSSNWAFIWMGLALVGIWLSSNPST